MILAAGLTPAWQQIMRFERLRPGAVNRAREVHWCASGKNLNAGMALAALGASSLTLAPLAGWSGRSIAAEFAARGLAGRWTTPAAATRVCTTILEDDGSATELVENAAPLSAKELQEFTSAYREAAAQADFVVLTGSLPPGTPPGFYRELLGLTRCPALLDVRGPELLAALECRPALVKPNREELGLTLGRRLDDGDSVRAAMSELIRRGARAVIVTHGKSAVLVMDEQRSWSIEPPAATPVVNPIGCGDCLAAGVAIGLSRGPLSEAVRLGLAAAADNLTQLLPARLDVERVRDWERHILREHS